MLGRGSGRVVEKWEDRLNSQQKEIREKINVLFTSCIYNVTVSSSSFILMCHFKSLYSHHYTIQAIAKLPEYDHYAAMPEQIPDPLAH